ncbi:MAG: putative secondary metabolism biosynthetic enzyme [Geoglossum umbratile]|nr:MAG: putative secondary metabolism biosynthetic enzyme [Geoglossum umbratile]
MASKIVVLITGANQGVGFETARNLLLSSTDYHVLLGTRDAAKGEAAAKALQLLPGLKGSVSHVQIDVTNDSSVDAAAAQVDATHGRLDTLVNNAGIFSAKQPAREALRDVLAVNVVGALSTTEAFLPLLRKAPAPRIVFVSSSVGSITHAADPKSKYYGAHANEYRASKAALNMLIVQYWARLGKDGFKVFGADPGLVATNFTGNPEQLRQRGAGTPADGGERIATVVKGERDADVGKVCGVYGVSPW